MTEPNDGVDIIGDVHGHADKLIELLTQMGYRRVDGAWKHPTRRAMFVGDLIDRGPKQVETVEIVRAMVESGSARMVLGNHEFNAIAWHTPDPDRPGKFLRPHSVKNRGQHKTFLDQVGECSDRHRECVRWFMTLPLWLDLGELRVVHACWDSKSMHDIAEIVDADNSLSTELVVEACRKGTREHQAIEHLLKGPEIPIPVPFVDSDENRREMARFRWWLADASSNLRAAAVIPARAKTPELDDYPLLPETPVEPQPQVDSYSDAVPVFYGHYWESGTPTVSGNHTACVDYSVAKGGPLVAYRWTGERTLVNDNFVMTGHVAGGRPGLE